MWCAAWGPGRKVRAPGYTEHGHCTTLRGEPRGADRAWSGRGLRLSIRGSVHNFWLHLRGGSVHSSNVSWSFSLSTASFRTRRVTFAVGLRNPRASSTSAAGHPRHRAPRRGGAERPRASSTCDPHWAAAEGAETSQEPGTGPHQATQPDTDADTARHPRSARGPASGPYISRSVHNTSAGTGRRRRAAA